MGLFTIIRQARKSVLKLKKLKKPTTLIVCENLSTKQT